MKKGFTLAEVLITLGIIGIVAAMTLPTLIAKYQKQVYTTQLKKFYTQLSQSLIQYTVDEGVTDFKNSGMTTSITKSEAFFKKYFKIVKECPSNFEPCMGAVYTKMSGEVIPLSRVSNTHRCFSFTGGSSLCVYQGLGNVLMQIAVDVNGRKAPNTAGRDLFMLYVYGDGKVDDLKTTCSNEDDKNCGEWNGVDNKPLTKEERDEVFEKTCNKAGATTYHGCFGKILNDNWEMNY